MRNMASFPLVFVTGIGPITGHAVNRELCHVDLGGRLKRPKTDIAPDRSRRAESKRYPAKSTDRDDNKRRRTPNGEKYKSNQRKPKISRGLHRTRPDRIVKRRAQETDDRRVYAPHYRLCPNVSPEGFPERQCANEY